MKLSFASALIVFQGRSVVYEPQIEVLPPPIIEPRPYPCFDSNMTFADTGNDGCDWYDRGTNYMTCGTYDTLDFKANEMCCACGGGSPVPVTYVMTC